jgi:hypothetical protein
MRLAIIGAGWYGCHLALELKKAGHDVALYEKNAAIFSQISGSFGIRLHSGTHYPRSPETRKNCAKNFHIFKERYPDLVVPHEYSVYGLGTKDANGNPSKVNEELFLKVSKETPSCKVIAPESAGYKELITAITVEEPSIAIGERLRTTFESYLKQEQVDLRCNFEVQKITPYNQGFTVSGNGKEDYFDKVINTTSYQAFLPDHSDFPVDMEVVYQTCLSLVYKDKKPGSRPFSFIVMDGWFPCMMPICDGNPSQHYILTHGKWTIMGSYNDPTTATKVLSELNDDWVEEQVKPHCEQEMNRFWPSFASRFEYVGWRGTVLAKLRTQLEFRSAITYEKKGIIQIFPGKVSNIFDVEHEVNALLKNENILESNGYRFVQDGVLQSSCAEITKKPSPTDQSTCDLQTLNEINAQTAQQAPLSSSQEGISSLPQEDNSYFMLSCCLEIATHSALFALSILALPFIGIQASVIIASVSALGVCGGIYRLFSSPNNQTKPAAVVDPADRLDSNICV